MEKLANSWWIYLLGGIVCIYVLIGCFIFIVKAIKDGKEIGMDRSIMKQAIIDSAIFSILPSISILIGLFALSGKIGIPFPWIRLTVIGAIHYEASAVDAAYSNIALQTITPTQFVTIAFVMTLGILTGPIFCLLFLKTYDKKVLSKLGLENEQTLSENNVDINEKKNKSFGPILFSAAFIAMICSFLAEYIGQLKYVGKEKACVEGQSCISSYTPTLVILVSFGSMALFTWISKKFKIKWLQSFSLGFSMIIGMFSSIIFEAIFGGM